MLQGSAVATAAATEGQALTWNDTTKAWTAGSLAAGGGGVEEGTNLGTGIEVFKETAPAASMQFRTLIGGAGITISSATSAITVDLNQAGLSSNDIGVGLTSTSTQTATNGTWTTLSFAGERWDTDGFHAASTTQIVVPANLGGKYFIHGQVSFWPNATGIRAVKIVKNGTTDIVLTSLSAATVGQTTYQSAQTIDDASVGDSYELQVWQDSGGNLDIRGTVGTAHRMEFMAQKLDITAPQNANASIAFVPVGASLYATVASSVDDSSAITLKDWQVEYDTHGFYNSASIPDRMTIPQDGIYSIMGGVTWATNSTGRRLTDIVRGTGGEIIGRSSQDGNDTGTTNTLVARILSLRQGEEIGLRVQQNSTGALNISHHSSATPFFNIQKIGEHPNSSALIAQGAVGACLFQTASSEINNDANFVHTDWQVGYDTHGFFNAASLLDRLTIPAGEEGIYAIRGETFYSINGTGRRSAAILINSVGAAHVNTAAQGDVAHRMEVNKIVNLVVGDEVQLFSKQNSGIGLSIINSLSDTPSLTIQKLAELPGLAPTRLLSGDNLGTGIEVYREKSGGSLQFRTLVAGENIDISSAASLVTVTHGDHGVKVYNASAFSVAGSSWVPLVFNTTRWDTDSYHTDGSDRVTIPTGFAGKYYMNTNIKFQQGTDTNDKFVRIIKNGANVLTLATGNQTLLNLNQTFSISTIAELSEGDFLQVELRHEGSAAITTEAGFAGQEERTDFVVQKFT